MQFAGDTGRARADSPSIPSRRAMLAGSTAALLTGAAIATTARGTPIAAAVDTGADAELLRLCAAFHRQHAAALAIGETGEYDEAELTNALDERWRISDRIRDTPASALAGYRAKASVGAVLLSENRGPDVAGGDADAAFAYAALLDIAGDAPTAPAIPSADAEIIALCDRLVAVEAEECAIFDTIKDEDERDRALEPTTREYSQIEDRLYALGNPATPEGVRAYARAAAATAPKNFAGEITAGTVGLAEWLAFGVVESLAGRTLA